jgi:hypothetical protein
VGNSTNNSSGNNKVFYTSSLDQDLQTVVRGIEARYGQSFRTNSFNSKDQTIRTRWLEAWLNPVSKKWDISEFKTTPDIYPNEEGKINADPKNVAEKKQTIAQGLCFFDALYELAKFELTEKQHGFEVQNKPLTDKQHFKIFAEHEGIPFAKDSSLPVPAAYGQILVDGVFDANARRIAKRSPASIMLPVKYKTESVFDNEIVPFRDKSLAIIDKDSEATLKLKFNKSSRVYKQAMNEALSSLRQCKYTGFKKCTDRSVVIVPFIPLIGQLMVLGNWKEYKKNLHESFPIKRFNKATEDLANKLADIPDAIDKEPMKRFASDVEMAYQMLFLRHIFRQYVNDEIQHYEVESHLNEFNRLAKNQGWEENRIKDTLQALQDSPQTSDYDTKILETLETRSADLSKWLGEIESELATFKPGKGPDLSSNPQLKNNRNNGQSRPFWQSGL